MARARAREGAATEAKEGITPPKEPPRPLFPRGEDDDRDKFFVVWSPYNRYLPSVVYDDLQEATKAARQAAEDNPGTDWFVLTAVRFAYKARGAAVAKDTK